MLLPGHMKKAREALGERSRGRKRRKVFVCVVK
jgi:hypothetical protein